MNHSFRVAAVSVATFFLIMHPTSTPIHPIPTNPKKKLENPTNLCYDIR